MALKDMKLTLDGQNHDIPIDTKTKQITAPGRSSYNQPGHVYAMVLRITDQAGNVTVIDQNHPTFGAAMKLRVKEKEAPVINIAKPGAGAYLTNQSVAIEFTVTDDGAGVNPDTIELQIDTQNTITPTKTTVSGGYRCTHTLTLRDGSHSIKINAQDFDGNAAVQKTVSFTVDTVPPTLNIAAPPETLITNKQSYTVSGNTNDSTSAPVVITMTLNGKDLGAVTVQSSGAFTKAVTWTEGTNTLIIKATDKAGKTSTVTRTVIYDADAPVVLSVSLDKNPVEAGMPFTITVEATD